jgi:probable DNA repair protein
MVNKTVYAAESKDSPIQILGIMEASGLTFDYMYLLDMNDSVWPAKSSPNVLLPEQLQIDNKMPHADAERELSFAKQIDDRFNMSCKEIVYSFNKTDNERELSASAFAKGAELPANLFTLNRLNHVDLLYKQIPITICEDTPVPLVEKQARGGVAVLTDTAKCPFSAFTKHRLKITELPRARMGFSPQRRGTILHEALAYLWSKLISHQSLVALSQADEIDLITESIAHAFEVETTRETVNPTLIKIETSKLAQIIADWLVIEKDRPPFSVKSIEEAHKLDLGPFVISIKVDRVDQIQSTGKALPIDYKLGSAPVRNLHLADTLTDLQLPVYSLTEENLEGVGYASLKSDNAKFSGLADKESECVNRAAGVDIRASSVSMSEQVEQWKQRLQELAQGYVEGQVNITPSLASCEYCPSKLICRV